MERIAEGSLLYYIRTEKYLIKRVKSQAGLAISAIIIVIIIISDRGMHETDLLDSALSVLGSGMVVGGRTESLFLIDMWYQVLPSATWAFCHTCLMCWVRARVLGSVAPWTWDGGLKKVRLSTRLPLPLSHA